MEFLQTVQTERDILRVKLLDMDRIFKSLDLSKKESDNRVWVLEK